MVARVCFITCVKRNGKFINITWTTLTKPQDCVYDSGGKKRCVHHHPHGNLAVNPPLADQSQEDGWSPASSENEDLDNQSVYTGPVSSMFGHLKGLQTNKVDEMGA